MHYKPAGQAGASKGGLEGGPCQQLHKLIKTATEYKYSIDNSHTSTSAHHNFPSPLFPSFPAFVALTSLLQLAGAMALMMIMFVFWPGKHLLDLTQTVYTYRW